MKILKSIIFVIVFIFPELAVANQYISKSSIVRIADDRTHEVSPWSFSFIPAGTIIYKLNKTKFIDEENRELFLTEDGIHIYLQDGKFWNVNHINSFKKWDEIVFIKRQYLAKITENNSNSSIEVLLTRGESYELIKKTNDGYVIELNGGNKFKGDLSTLKINIEIPREYVNYVKVSNYKKIDSINKLVKVSVGGAYGIQSGCGVGKVKEYPFVKVSYTMNDLYVEADVNGEDEANEILSLGKDVIVRREYYRRLTQKGIYKVTIIKPCNNTNYSYFRISTPYINDVLIDREWVKRSAGKVRLSDPGGRALLQCSEDYFAIEKQLKEHFYPEDIPFLIYMATKWGGFKDECV